MGLRSLAAAAVLILGTVPAQADDPEAVAQFRDWQVYTYHEEGRQHCYAATAAINRRGQTEGWQDSWVLVSNDPLRGLRHAVSYSLDRPLREGSRVRATLSDRTFEMLTEGDTAWTPDDRTDLRLIVAMKRGRRMVVSATAAHGERVLDTFSLMGFTDALNAAAKTCREASATR